MRRSLWMMVFLAAPRAAGAVDKPALAPAQNPPPVAKTANAPAPPAGQKPAAEKPAEEEKVYTPELEQKLETGLQHAFNKDFYGAATNLFEVLMKAPEGEPKRDEAELHFARALDALGLTQAAVEYDIEIALGHRSPEMVGRALGALADFARRRVLDEDRLVNEVLFGSQYGDLPAETNEFVEYYQALGELRHGLQQWGTARLESLAKADTPYAWRARYALGVHRIIEKNEEGADKLFEGMANSEKAPEDVRNGARTAEARLLYERKKYTDAFALYSKVDAPLQDLDLVLLEKAWTKVAERDERRALGMVIGLGAPIYRHIFAPERDLIRAVALNRLCQFRAAHLTVLAFRDLYRDVLTKIRERKSLEDDKLIREAAMSGDLLSSVWKQRGRLAGELDAVANLRDAALRDHLRAIYDLRIEHADAIIARGLDAALQRVADELLRVDEQMNIIDYEIGVGLFKRSREESLSRERLLHLQAPLDSKQVFYHFDGEYWGDELNDFSVFADDRCVQ